MTLLCLEYNVMVRISDAVFQQRLTQLKKFILVGVLLYFILLEIQKLDFEVLSCSFEYIALSDFML